MVKKNPSASLVKNTSWVIAGFGLGQAVRLASSIIMARLLAPEIFGIMVIAYSIRGGIELLTDIGVGQSIIANKAADLPEFYNTAWTLRLLRGVALFVFCALLAAPLSEFYKMPILLWVIPVMGLSFPIVGLGSLGAMFLQKQQRSARLSTFELFLEVTTSLSQILFALFSPTIWAFIFGGLFQSTSRAIGNYIVAPNLRHRFFISKQFANEILRFGFWIFLSSLIYFLSANFDRLYLGKAIPLEMLGIYGIARSLAEIAVTLVNRLNFIVIFPFIASHSDSSRLSLRTRIGFSRATFLVVAAACLATVVVSSDLLVATLYDPRYHGAGWMLAALTIGVWFSVICTINESSLLGFGKPHYAVIANGLKLGWLMIGIPALVVTYGIVGVMVVVCMSDVWRYVPIFIGQRKELFSFGRQDLVITLVFFLLITGGEWARWSMGFGTSFDGLCTSGAGKTCAALLNSQR